MTYYEFLLGQKESGHLKKWLQIGAPSQIPKWMEIYEYHRRHPSFSQLKLSADLETSTSTVQRALAFMNQSLM